MRGAFRPRIVAAITEAFGVAVGLLRGVVTALFAFGDAAYIVYTFIR